MLVFCDTMMVLVRAGESKIEVFLQVVLPDSLKWTLWGSRVV